MNGPKSPSGGDGSQVGTDLWRASSLDVYLRGRLKKSPRPRQLPEEGAGAADSTGLAQFESAYHRFRIGLDDPKQRRCRTGGPPTALLVLLHRVQREAESPSDIVPESAPTLPGAPEPVPARAAGAQAPRSPTHRRSTHRRPRTPALRSLLRWAEAALPTRPTASPCLCQPGCVAR